MNKVLNFDYSKTQQRIFSYIEFFLLLSLCGITIGNFIYPDHVAVANICGAAAIFFGIFHRLCSKDFSNHRVLIISCISIGLIPMAYYISLKLHNVATDDFNYYFRIRTIAILYALAFIFCVPLRPSYIKYVFYTFIFCCFCISIYIFINIIRIKYDPTITDQFFRIQELYYNKMPFKKMHHVVSYYLSFSCLLIFYLFDKRVKYMIGKVELAVLAIMFFVIVVVMHAMAVRNGLIIFYIATTFFTIMIFKNNKFILTLIPVALFIALFCTMKLSPALYTKINQTLYDVHIMFETNDYGDRMRSILVGVELIKESPILGIGYTKGDNAIQNYYSQHHPSLNWHAPHNMFINFTVYMGIPLGIFITFLIYLPYLLGIKKYLLNIFYVPLTFYFSIEMPFSNKDFYYFATFWLLFLVYTECCIDYESHKLDATA